ncbi:DinB family protein [Brevibacillus fluminis]|uniref:DinB family protein n=1 Tax=Brevibacillus fluminis TaxID=511487 RepID=A0A3M8DG64_9BACL|nr:DinB family protein [Brevibacillus fluminis]RNB87092.1 DinB family protein [Brevibacillus fluminis]
MSQSKIDINSYLAIHQHLQEAIAGLTAEQLVWKEAPHKWSVTEVLAHLADHNLIVSFRIRAILAGSTDRLPGFDQDKWVSETRANQSAAADILALFQALLVYNSSLFSRLTDEEWEKEGINFKGEPLTLAGAVQAFIKHAHHHIGQIERIKEAHAAAVAR